MKNIASAVVVAASIFAAALPSSAQVPIFGGKLSISGEQTAATGFNNNDGHILVVNSSSNFLTPAGILSLSSLPNSTYVYTYTGVGRDTGLAPASGSISSTSSPGDIDVYVQSVTLTGIVDGNLAGTSFTSTPIVIKASTSTIDVSESNYFLHKHGWNSFTHVFDSSLPTDTVTGTLMLNLNSDYLPVRSDLRISYSTLPSSDKEKPEYPQEYRNDFHSSSFEGGRILDLEDK